MYYLQRHLRQRVAAPNARRDEHRRKDDQMNRRRRIPAIVIAGILLSAHPAPAVEIDPLRDAANALVDWFVMLNEKFDEIARDADRRRVARKLADFRKDLYRLESEKRYLIREIKIEMDFEALEELVVDAVRARRTS